MEMIKGIDVHICSGVHVRGFTELTNKAKEIAKKKIIDAIQKDQIALHWNVYEEEENA